MQDLSLITDLAKAVYEANKLKGFWDEPVPSFPEKVMTIVTGLAEAVEAHKNGNHAAPGALERAMAERPFAPSRFQYLVKGMVEDKLADAFMRLFDICGQLGIDIGKHIEAKLEYNKTRPYKHGKLY